jgi:glycyl-tRNA synthetase
MANEMAHYASDCWDAEIHSSYGWIECVGCADRSCYRVSPLFCNWTALNQTLNDRSAYDLTVHSARTNTKLVVREALKEPVTQELYVPIWDRKKLGPTFQKDSKVIEETVNAYDQARLACIAGELENDGRTLVKAANGQDYELRTEHLTVQLKSVTEAGMLASRSLPVSRPFET